MASSSSSSFINIKKHDVFLSFRGEDTRHNFTSHFYAALLRKKVQTYIDDELNSGEEISYGLLKAIEESKLSVIIFSENYASSSWCLNELLHILRCKERDGQKVIPIFYHVDPSCVRKQQGRFKQAFDELGKRNDRDKMCKWSVALTEAANLSGWPIQENRSESEQVEAIVEDIIKKLNDISSPSYDFKEQLVGMDRPMQKIESLLQIGLLDVRIVGLWGMGGVGKTTLASVIFNKLSHQFEGCCFLENVSENWAKRRQKYRNKLFSVLLMEKNINVSIPFVGSTFSEARLRQKKVLLVLDDVKDQEQLEYFVGSPNYLLGPGSRIILTSRDRQSFGAQVSAIYKVEGLDYYEARQLFCLNAFKRNSPVPYSKELLERVVRYADGIPLALKALGSFFGTRGRDKWDRLLAKLETSPKIGKVQSILMISYNDGLDDDQKDVFLDIACFFKGYKRDDVERILGGSDLFADIIIDDLVDKSLLTINDKNRLCMHDLIQEMGREIVHQQSIKEPGKRSRLWIAQDVYHVLRNNTATAKVEGIFLDVSDIKEVHLSPATFQETYNLRLLKVYSSGNIRKCKVHLPQGLHSLPNALRYFYWDEYPLKSLPSNFIATNLVELSMVNSQVKQLWEGVQNLCNLKIINFRYCKYLIKMPDLSCARNLERIDVRSCVSLFGLTSHNSQNLERLAYLNISDCKRLGNLPDYVCSRSLVCLDLSGTEIEGLPVSIGSFNKLEKLRLNNCERLKKLPSSMCQLKSLKKLNLNGTSIEEIPSTIELLCDLKVLNIQDCKRLQTLPTSICKLKSLKFLYLCGCSEFENFPEILEPMNLMSLDLSRTKIKELPSSIENIVGLQILHMELCENLKFVPSNIYNLTKLFNVTLSGCSDLLKWPPRSVGLLWDLTQLTLLDSDAFEILDWLCSSPITHLHIRGKYVDKLPASIGSFSSLQHLCVRDWKNLRYLPELPSSLCTLDASSCTSLETVPSSKWIHEQWTYNNRKHRMCFVNCLKLDQDSCRNVIADAQFRIWHIAINIFSGFPRSDVCICYPGNDIPKWFKSQAIGSSINLNPPSDWLNSDFIGFSACFVAAFEEHNYSNRRLDFQFEVHLKTKNGGSCKSKYSSFAYGGVCCRSAAGKTPTIINSDHVFLLYEPCNFIACKQVEDVITEVSFHFYPVYEYWDPMYKYFEQSYVESCKVKKCGIRMLYRQEAEELGFSIADNSEMEEEDEKNPNGAEITESAKGKEEDNRPNSKSETVDEFNLVNDPKLEKDDAVRYKSEPSGQVSSIYDYDAEGNREEPKEDEIVESVTVESADENQSKRRICIETTAEMLKEEEPISSSCGCFLFLSSIRAMLEDVLGKKYETESDMRPVSSVPPRLTLSPSMAVQEKLQAKDEAIKYCQSEVAKLPGQKTVQHNQCSTSSTQFPSSALPDS